MSGTCDFPLASVGCRQSATTEETLIILCFCMKNQTNEDFTLDAGCDGDIVDLFFLSVKTHPGHGDAQCYMIVQLSDLFSFTSLFFFFFVCFVFWLCKFDQ